MAELIQFANTHPYLASAVVASLLAVLAYEVWLKGQGLSQVTAAMAVRLINKGALILDVRTPEAFGEGHIVNARNLPLEKLESEPDALKKSKSKVLLTVCDNGMVAGRAAKALQKAGFEQVYSLKGGIGAWRTENLPLVKSSAS
jgi:rhodanese-related sulfurtransferase